MLTCSYKMKGFTMKYYNSKRFLSRIADRFGRAVLVAAGVFAVGAALTASAADWTDANNVTYTALKSLKGANSGYVVVTNITPLCTDIVKMKFQPVAAVGALFCARDASASGMFTCYHSSTDGSIRIDRGAKSTSNQKTSNSKVSTGNDYLLTADYGYKTATIVLSGGGVDLFGKALGGADTYTVGSPLVLLAMHSNLKSYSSYGTDYIYYFELYDSSGNLTHCLLPAQRDSDSVNGFYDTRTGTFYPQSGGALTAAVRTVNVTDTCKKWTGRGDGVSMSQGANWEGGVAPGDGDNLDFTLAPPLAEINADIPGVTFGKLWIDDDDIPTFTGSLTVSGCNNRAKVAGNTSVVFLAGNYTWRGTETNWGDADAWTLDNAAATWADNNNAIFNTADATATLTADVEANSLAFNQNATVAGSATLTVPTVSVAADVSATISAPTAGALAKIGAGTLTLTQSRAAATTISEGTLTMSGNGTTIDWSNFTLGTDAAKPVTLRFENGAALAAIPSSWYVGDVPGVTATLVKDGGDWAAPSDLVIGRKAGATTTFIHKGGTLSVARYFFLGRDASANLTTLEICGGTVSSTKTGGGNFMQIGILSDARVVVTNNATFSVADRLVIGGEGNSAANGTLDIANGTVTVADDLLFGYTSTWSGTGTVNLGTGGMLQLHQVRFVAGAGSGNTFNFNGGTLKARSATTTFIKASDKLTVNVLAAGGMIDNNGKNITIEESLNGPGTINLTGSGATTFAAGVGAEGGVSVANGTTLTINGTSQSSFGSLTLAAGSTLNIADYDGTTPVSASALALPSEGTVNLKFNGGAFGKGIYAICAAQGVTAADGGKFTFDTTDNQTATWSVADGTLLLAVGDISGNYWTGRGGDGKMSTAANWLNGVPAEGDDIDFSVISADTTIIADAGHGFGAVTMGDGVITFTNAFAAASFSDTSKVAVGADSTVTINGDLVFSWSDTIAHPICNNVAAGGVFRVTGSIIADSANRGYIVPCPGSIDGTIAAAGLVNNSSNDDDVFRLVRGGTVSSVNWEIGAAGFSGTRRFVVFNTSGSHATIRAAANFTVSAMIVQYRSLTLDTAGHVVTLGTDTSAKSGGILGGAAGGMTTVTGAGRVVVNYDVNDLSALVSSRTNAFTVATGATLAFNPGGNIGPGALTVQDGGTLEIQSGTTTFGNLTVEGNAILGFNFTDRRVVPQLALYDGAEVTALDPFTVKVSGTVWPSGGEKLLTTCGGFDGIYLTLSVVGEAARWAKPDRLSVNGDGNIVLAVKPMGTMILFR